MHLESWIKRIKSFIRVRFVVLVTKSHAMKQVKFQTTPRIMNLIQVESWISISVITFGEKWKLTHHADGEDGACVSFHKFD